VSAAQTAGFSDESTMTTAIVNGAALHLDHHGAVWWPAERTLVVADMHLEKGSAFAARGQLLPPYDSAVTLAKLTRVIARHRPQRLIALGDSFHDVGAGARMEEAVFTALSALSASVEMVWITGNHDPEIPSGLPGARMAELVLGPLTLRHEPQRGSQPGEIAGHLHPAAKVVSERGKVRRPAFVTDGSRMILPAFGAYTGGLNCLDPVIARLFDKRMITAHVCGGSRVYSVNARRLAGV
jgi:uncharacterized protein